MNLHIGMTLVMLLTVFVVAAAIEVFATHLRTYLVKTKLSAQAKNWTYVLTVSTISFISCLIIGRIFWNQVVHYVFK